MRRPARKAKSKRATKTKKAAKAKKAAAVKKSAKTTKKATKKKTGAKKARALAGGPLGCCTLTGEGPDTQIEGITKAECRRRAIAQGKNDRWVEGKCAQPG